tara:strand:- start:2144 stop:2593 length:450 start_codon:yes stop_codon:yes gene_type:complete
MRILNKIVNSSSCVIFSLVAIIIILFSQTSSVMSLSTNQLFNKETEIIEYLRLYVPSDKREEWIFSEQESWEPWLKTRKGFLGRLLFWDKDSEEATLLIFWDNRSDWKSIPKNEIKSVQDHFEKVARLKTGVQKGNPFPLRYEGELIPQ